MAFTCLARKRSGKRCTSAPSCMNKFRTAKANKTMKKGKFIGAAAEGMKKYIVHMIRAICPGRF
ncbi:MAG: hypothetical protein BAA00_13045 [Parageobacillus thermoglucosidasius]|nr:hypothetical protein [Parageobacillus thermoglucosidasius]OUM88042.1 MAG: hypothetical protein BAA00_13045 [Parageobacillus thermoglucosidasius]